MSDWSLARGLAAFSQALRQADVAVGPAESRDALAALRHINPLDEAAVQASLRACMAKTPEARATFDQVFDDFWHARIAQAAKAVHPEDEDEQTQDEAQPAALDTQPAVSDGEDEAGQSVDDNSGAAGEGIAMGLDLATVAPAEQAAMDALIRALGQRLALRHARRWHAASRGRLDLRASMRRALRHGGEMLELRRRHKPRIKPRLVVLADVSYSMDAYSRFFLLFVWSFRRVFRSVEAFVFATALTRITPSLAREDIAAALDGLHAVVDDWGGGTQIGASIDAYLAQHADAQLDRHTLVMIVSDGWDAGEPAALEAALAKLRPRCRAIIWLDPLMEHPRYFVSALGMQHESAHVDLCAPARNINALSELADRLVREKLI